MSEQAGAAAAAGDVGGGADKSALAGADAGADAGKAAGGADAGKAAGDAGKSALADGGGADKKDDAGAAKKDDGKGAAAEPAYAAELKRPDGVPWSDEAWGAVAPVLAKHNISKEAAQDLVDAFGSQAAKEMQTQQEAQRVLAVAREEARAECKRTFKQEDFNAARRAVEKGFQDKVLVEHMLNVLGDNVDFIRGMARFGRVIADDSSPGATGSGGGGASVRTADKLYK